MPTSEDGASALTPYLIGDNTLAATLAHVVGLATDVLPAAMAGITMLVEGRPVTAVFTDSEAPEIDEAQYAGGSGPCVEALHANRMVKIPSVPDDDRWPQFTGAAERHGIMSTLSFPLSGTKGALGALNLYARHPHAFAADHEQLGTKLAGQAALLLLNAQVHAEARQLNENLRHALNSRATIDYAIGILVAQSGQDLEHAFQILVRASQRENRKLREIAAELVDRSQRRPRQPGGGRGAGRGGGGGARGAPARRGGPASGRAPRSRTVGSACEHRGPMTSRVAAD